MSFFVTGGTVPVDSGSYAERQADKDLLAALLAGEFCFVLNSRQMGKSSLSVRTMAALREAGTRVVFLDLTKIGGQNAQPEQFYAGLLSELARGLDLRRELLAHYKTQLDVPAPLRLVSALREIALEKVTEPIVVFVDEVDAVRSLPFPADELFAAIRACYNARTEDAAYRRLTFCLVGSATPADLIRDTRTSPFNVGKRIELRDFTPEEAAPLAAGLPGGRATLERVLYWTGGHPYLTQAVCAALAESGRTDVDSLIASRYLDATARSRDANLADVANRMIAGSDEEKAAILEWLQKVRRGRPSVADDETNPLLARLKLSGAVRTENGTIRLRNRIYERVFDATWIRDNLPDAEVRRQKEAYRKGTLRTGLAAGVIIAIVAALALLASSQASRARQSAAKLSVALDESEHTSYINAMNVAQSAYENNNVARTLALLEETKNSRFRGWEWNYWNHLCHQGKIILKGHTGGVGAVAFSPDGERIVTGSQDNTAKVWNAKTGQLLLTLAGHTFEIYSVAFSPDGKQIATGSLDYTVKIWDATTGKEQHTLKGHTNQVVSVAFSHDGRTVLSCGVDKTARVWDLATGRELLTLPVSKESEASSVASSPDGRQILTGSWDYTTKVWDAKTGKVVRTLKGHIGAITSITFSSDGRRILTGSLDHTLKVWDAATGKELHTLGGHQDRVRTVVFQANGQRILTCADDGTVRIWDTQTGKELQKVQGHVTPLSAAFSPDGQHIVTGNSDSTATVWKIQPVEEPLTLRGHKDLVASIDFSPDGRRVVTGSWDNTAKLWDATSSQELRTFRGDCSFSTFSRDGRYIATASWNNTAKLWDTGTGKEILTFHNSRATGRVSFSPDGRQIIGVGDGVFAGNFGVDKIAKVWDTQTGSEQYTLKGHHGMVFYATFSPNGKQIATASLDNTAKLWNARTGKEILTLKGHQSQVSGVAFSPDSRLIITSSSDGSAKVWNAQTGQEIRTLRGHATQVWCASFSPDGKRIVTGSWDKTAKLWDVESGRELLTLRGNDNAIYWVTFSPDGKRIATASADGTARIWSSEPLATQESPR